MNGPSLYDDAVVGAGILGLAHAYHLARRGRRVVVIERGDRAQGASIRNFGMLWPIGQPFGERRTLADRSLSIWREVLASAPVWHASTGSLHLAHHDDEAEVLREFSAIAHDAGHPCEWLSARDTKRLSPAVRTEGLRGALWSPTEVCVDPREIIATLPGWLNTTFGVEFRFGTLALGFDRPEVRTSRGAVKADRLWVCSGDDFQTLFPEVFVDEGIVRCKLQMLRTPPIAAPWSLGPMLAGGLTLRHYASFEGCPSLAALKSRVALETPEFDRFGIHVMAAQNGRGEVVIGDSHEYGAEIAPFDRTEIESLILGYLGSLVHIPDLTIDSRWNGTYAKHPRRVYFVQSPQPGVTIVTCAGGAGMTLSFGLAERTVLDAE